MSASSEPLPEQAIVLDDTVIYHRVVGEEDAPPLLYLHGAGVPPWTPAIQELAQTYRLYAPDLPGFGQSVAGESLHRVEDVADVFGAYIQAVVPTGTTAIVGTSLGATLALWITARRPDVVEKLVIAAPTAFRPEGATPLSSLPRDERLARMYAYPERAEAVGSDTSEDQPSVAGLERLIQARTWDDALFDRLPDIGVSTLALFGIRDGIIPTEMARIYRRHMPHCQVMFVYNAGHVLHVERPDVFVRLVRDFLAYEEGFFRNRGSTGYMRAPGGTLPTGVA
jgi:pimeloyl-ACP methyl ester carboxylesterase